MTFIIIITVIIIYSHRKSMQPWDFEFAQLQVNASLLATGWQRRGQIASKQSNVLSNQLFWVFIPLPNISPLSWRCDIWMTPSGRRSVVFAECWRCDSLWEPAQVTLIKQSEAETHEPQAAWPWVKTNRLVFFSPSLFFMSQTVNKTDIAPQDFCMNRFRHKAQQKVWLS